VFVSDAIHEGAAWAIPEHLMGSFGGCSVWSGFADGADDHCFQVLVHGVDVVEFFIGEGC
jgi:hypothetical protein